MNPQQRRKEIAALLMSSETPLTGSWLSQRLGASRQIIVGDIASLKREGFDIASTHTGYVMKKSPYPERVVKCRHSSEQTLDELCLIVAFGATVVDVFVNHKVYGQIKAKLNIYSQNSAEEFACNISQGKSVELMNLTSGYHYHTIRAQTERVLDEIESALEEKGYLVK